MSRRVVKEKPVWRISDPPDASEMATEMVRQGYVNFSPLDRMKLKQLEKALRVLNARSIYASAAANSIAILSQEMENLSQVSPSASEALRVLLQSATVAIVRDIAGPER